MATERWKDGDNIPASGSQTPKAEELRSPFTSDEPTLDGITVDDSDFTRPMDTPSNQPPSLTSLAPVAPSSTMCNPWTVTGCLSDLLHLRRDMNRLGLDPANFQRLQMQFQANGGNGNDNTISQLSGNPVSYGGGASERPQSYLPEKLDRSFLALETGGNTEMASKTDAFQKDMTGAVGHNMGCHSQPLHSQSLDKSSMTITSSMQDDFSGAAWNTGQWLSRRNSIPQSNTFFGENAYRRPLNTGSYMANRLSNSRSSAGGFSSLSQNVGGISCQPQNAGGSHTQTLSVGSRSLFNSDGGVAGGNDAVFASNLSSQHLPLALQNDQQCHPYIPSIEGNSGGKPANADPTKHFQGSQGSFLVSVTSGQAGWQDFRQQRMTSFPTTQVTSNRELTSSPFVGVVQGAPKQEQTDAEGNAASASKTINLGRAQENTQIESSSSLLAPSYAFGQAVAVSKGSEAAQNSAGLSRTFSKRSSCVVTDEVTMESKGSGPTQDSTSLAGETCKRSRKTLTETSSANPQAYMSAPLPTAFPFQLSARQTSLQPRAQTTFSLSQVQTASFPSKGASMSAHPSAQSKAQTSSLPSGAHASFPTSTPTAFPVQISARQTSLPPRGQATFSPSQVQTASFPSKGASMSAPSVQSIAQASRLPSTARPALVPHIRREARPVRSPQLSGFNCFLCKRDLSYAAEGPYVQPNQRPEVAVLPCGHCCHALCLHHITPDDQARDPPCIPCALGEK